MKFRVIKSSFDGICGLDALLEIKEACLEIVCAKGWPNISELRKAIKRWAKVAIPGQVFKTFASVIVAAENAEVGDDAVRECPECGEDNSAYFDFYEIEAAGNGKLSQVAHCRNCGNDWRDVFALVDRQPIKAETK